MLARLDVGFVCLLRQRVWISWHLRFRYKRVFIILRYYRPETCKIHLLCNISFRVTSFLHFIYFATNPNPNPSFRNFTSSPLNFDPTAQPILYEQCLSSPKSSAANGLLPSVSYRWPQETSSACANLRGIVAEPMWPFFVAGMFIFLKFPRNGLDNG